MRKFTIYTETLIAGLLFLLVGCANQLTMNEIQFAELGMSSESLSSMVEQNPLKVFGVVDPETGLEYEVHIFPMQTGTRTTFFTIYLEDGVMHYYPTTYPVTENFAFLFRENSLLFWGFLHDFFRSDEQLNRRLAPIIVEGVEKGR